MPRNRVLFILAGLAAMIVFAIAEAGPFMSKVEEASYRVERSDGPLELRAYPQLVVAQVTTYGARRTAISDGFSMIAGYIFGGNAAGKKVAMTAPVLQQRVQDAAPPGDNEPWAVRFVMPRQWSLAILPKPNDARVTVSEQPAATFAVIRFSGLAGDARIAEKTRALNAYIASQKLHGVGTPILAFFNPPWTLPFLRRNEIMIAVSSN